MRLSTKLRHALWALPVVVTFACSDGPTAPAIVLSDAEITDAFGALMTVGGLGMDTELREAVEPSMGSASITQSLSETTPCPAGGSVRISGSVSSNTSGTSTTIDLRQRHLVCAVEGASGRLWVFNGDPNIRMKVTLHIDELSEDFTMTGSFTGAVLIESEGNSGRCAFNLTMSLGISDVSVSGTVCGREFNESVSGF